MMATPPTPLTCRTTTATPWLPMNAYASCASVLCVCRYGPHMAVPVLVAVCPPVYHDDASDNNYDGDNDDIHENHDQEKNKHGREKKKKGVPGASSLSSALGALSLADHQTKENNNKACALSSSSAAAPTTIHTALEWLQGILHDSHTSMQALGNTEGSDGDTGENGTGDAEKHKRVLGKHNKTGTGTHVKIQPMQSSDHVSGHGSGHGSGHVSQRSKVAWWKRRLQLDARVGGVLDMMSDEVLGAARYVGGGFVHMVLCTLHTTHTHYTHPHPLHTNAGTCLYHPYPPPHHPITFFLSSNVVFLPSHPPHTPCWPHGWQQQPLLVMQQHNSNCWVL